MCEGARESLAHQLLPAGQDPALGRVVGKRAVALLQERMLLAADHADDVAGQPQEAQIRIDPVVGQRADHDVELAQPQPADQPVGKPRVDREADVGVAGP